MVAFWPGLVRIRAIQLEAGWGGCGVQGKCGVCRAGMLCVGNFDVGEFERVGVKEKSTPALTL